MKIAFIGQKGIPAKPGGVERHVENLALFLAKKNYEVLVYNRRENKKEKQGNWQGVDLVYLPYINSKNLAAISLGFLATLNAMRQRVDIIHYHGIGPSLLAWIPRLFRPRTKIVATLHSFDYNNDKWSGFAKFMLKLGEKMMCKFAHEIIVLTDFEQNYLLQKHNRKSTVVPNGAKVELNPGDDILAKFSLEKGSYIISVSRLIRLKGIQYLIEAFKQIEDPELKLVIVGDGEYAKDLHDLSIDDERIIFTGNQEGRPLSQLFANAKLFVQSSEIEGLSISLLEAMAYGLPIVASNIPANKQAGAETLNYFRSEDILDLKEKILYNIQNSEKSLALAEKAKTRAENLYSWEKIVDRIINIYHENSANK